MTNDKTTRSERDSGTVTALVGRWLIIRDMLPSQASMARRWYLARDYGLFCYAERRSLTAERARRGFAGWKFGTRQHWVQFYRDERVVDSCLANARRQVRELASVSCTPMFASTVSRSEMLITLAVGVSGAMASCPP